MSGGAKPTFLMPVYDAQELRRRMAVCFTIGELYRFAEKLGVPSAPAWSNSPQDAARDIVRHFDRSGALPFLVEALQEAKPLVEWPAPAPAQPTASFEAPPSGAVPPAAPSGPGAAPPGGTAFASPVAAAFAGEPTAAGPATDRPTPISTISAAAVFASSAARSTPPAAPAAPAGFAPAIMPRPGEAPPPPASGAALPEAAAPAAAVPSAPLSGAPLPGAGVPGAPASGSAAPARTAVDSDLAAFMSAAAGPPAQPVILDPAFTSGAGWPGTVRPGGKPGPRPPPDYRLILGGGAALLLVAVALAFFVGRASSPAAPEAGSGATAAPADHVVMSQHVARALSESLARVARECQIDLTTLRGHPLLQVAYHRCGPLPPQALAPQRPAHDDDPLLDPTPGDDPPEPPKQGRISGNKLQKVVTAPAPGPVSGGSGCLSRCSQSHGGCTSRCGAEPKQGSQYDAYQSCLGGCLKALSQCKLGCQ